MTATMLPAGLRRMLPVDLAPRPVAPVRLVKLCAWCPPVQKRAREAAAHALGCSVTHGVCPACRDKMLAELPAGRRAS